MNEMISEKRVLVLRSVSVAGVLAVVLSVVSLPAFVWSVSLIADIVDAGQAAGRGYLLELILPFAIWSLIIGILLILKARRAGITDEQHKDVRVSIGFRVSLSLLLLAIGATLFIDLIDERLDADSAGFAAAVAPVQSWAVLAVVLLGVILAKPIYESRLRR